MTTVSKKVYNGLALLALLNMVVVGGLIAFLVGTGQLTSERVQQFAAVLRGEWPEPQQVQEELVEDQAAPTKSVESIDREQEEDETGRLRADRRRAELEQQAATIARARLEVTRKREALERRAADIAASNKRREKEEESAGFKKELELLGSLKPKDAIYYLLQKPKEDAAALLLVMESRKAKRVLGAAKTLAQKRVVSEILQIMREMSPEQANGLLAKKG